MRLSIIIPVYNAEKYLVECLDSVFSQDMPQTDYEVIAINDGSKDSSLEILKKYELKFSNLVVLSQENKGEAETRNLAIANTKGTYIAFVDSDDSVQINTFKTILDRAERDRLDILYLNIKLFTEEGVFISEFPSVGNENQILSGFEHPRRTFPATLYKTSLVKNVSFIKEIIIGPDSVFNAMVQTRAQRCGYLSLPHYKYTFREDSLSKQGKTERAYLGFLVAIEVLAKFQKNNFPILKPNEKVYFDTIISIFITRILDYNILPNLDKQRFRTTKKAVDDLGYNHVWDLLAKQYKYVNKSELVYFSLHNYLRIKRFVYLLVQTLKRKLIC